MSFDFKSKYFFIEDLFLSLPLRMVLTGSQKKKTETSTADSLSARFCWPSSMTGIRRHFKFIIPFFVEESEAGKTVASPSVVYWPSLINVTEPLYTCRLFKFSGKISSALIIYVPYRQKKKKWVASSEPAAVGSVKLKINLGEKRFATDRTTACRLF